MSARLARWAPLLAPLLLCVLAGAVLGLGARTFWYAEGLSYLSSDPRACVNCHIMRDEYDGWQKASHHAHAVCIDCHLPHDLVGKYLAKAENGFWHSKAFTFQDFHEPIRIHEYHARQLEANCIACHREKVNDIVACGSAFTDNRSGCVRCHAQVGHGPER